MNSINSTNILSALNISDKIYYFKEVTIEGEMCISKDFESINNILSLAIDINPYFSKLIATKAMTSNEGGILTGFNLIIDYSLKCNMKYTSFGECNNIFLSSFFTPLNSCTIVVPKTIDNIAIEDILKRNLFSISHNVEYIDFNYIDNNTFYYNITTLFIFTPLTDKTSINDL